MKADWARYLNLLATGAGDPRNLVSLEGRPIIEAAKTIENLSDFGSDIYLDNFEKFFEEKDMDSSIHVIGRLIIKSRAILLLRNRLLICEKINKEENIWKEEIKDPIFITGNPRSGTSILYELMGLDKTFRSPLTWEANFPINKKENPIYPIETAQSTNDLFMELIPELKALHQFRSDLAVECFQINGMDLPWWITGDHEADKVRILSIYNWHKNFLKVLQHKQPERRWLMKCPSHLKNLEQLLETYPDATIIYIHRDPKKSINSQLCLFSLISDIKRSDALDIKIFEESINKMVDVSIKLIEKRSYGALKHAKIIDFYYSDFVKSPSLSIKNLYKEIGVPFTNQLNFEIENYLRTNPLKKFGKSLTENFYKKIPNEIIEKKFENYMNYYGINNEK